MAHREQELDLENGPIDCEEEKEHYSGKAVLGLKKKAKMLLAKVKGGLADGSDDDGGVSSSDDASNTGRVNVENVEGHNNIKNDDAKENRLVKENGKSLSTKKSQKPPRPPRSPSLDAADQKLIRELADLARLKRSRIKRMEALKKMKIPKGASSFGSNVLVLVLTIVLCLVILFRGMPSKGTPASFEGSRVPVEVAEGVRSSVRFLKESTCNYSKSIKFSTSLFSGACCWFSC